MGWTSYRVADSKINRKAELDKELWKYSENTHGLLKSRMVGSTYYAAAKYFKTGEVIGFVTLTSIVADNWGAYDFYYKEMCETMGPTEAKCPESILNLLSPTDNEFANDWRKRCREYNRLEKMYKSGRSLKGICRYNLSDGYEKGDEVKLYWIERNIGTKIKRYYTDGFSRFPKNIVLELDNLQYM